MSRQLLYEAAADADMLKNGLSPGIAWYGALARDAAYKLPERHLGLVQAASRLFRPFRP